MLTKYFITVADRPIPLPMLISEYNLGECKAFANRTKRKFHLHSVKFYKSTIEEIPLEEDTNESKQDQ